MANDMSVISFKGRRVYPAEDGALWLSPGDYGKRQDGVWCARPPICHRSKTLSGSLEHHNIEEHPDGTISVSPSIIIADSFPVGEILWHGELKKGIWLKQ